MTKTRHSVLRRMNGLLPARHVPKFAQDVIDHVAEIFRGDAFDLYPRSDDAAIEEQRYWERLDYYKKKVMSAFLREFHTEELERLLRGRIVSTGTAAIWFHQYIAAVKRAASEDVVVEDCPLSVSVGELQDAHYLKR